MAKTFTREELEKMLQTLIAKNAKAICGTCGDTDNDDGTCACDWDE